MQNRSFHNRITSLFGIRLPIIQAGMVWCSGWRLASAVSNAGGLGLIGAGSMHPELLREHIEKAKLATDASFGVNIPLLYPEIDKLMDILTQTGVKIVFTSAGNPSTWTAFLKKNEMKVVHVVSSLKFALKAEEAGADAIVGEGFEAGGHNGREETTTLCLIPSLVSKLTIPVIAAGGIFSGSSMMAAFALGAEGVQIGSRYAACDESSAHPLFKQKVVEAKEGDTELLLKTLAPVRMLKNELHAQLKTLEQQGAGAEQLKAFMGKGRSKMGVFEGNLTDGELEIGQIASMINNFQTAGEITKEIWEEFIIVQQRLSQL